jgi:hypothetical protein
MLSNAQLFFESLVHTEHKLCGLRLKPLCLLHLLWLEHVKSPLLSSDRRVTMRDLELAAVICSSSSSDEIMKRVARPGYVWHWRNTFRNVTAEAKAWLAFFNDYFSLPELLEREGSGANKLPWLAVCIASLVKETGWSLEKVLLLPVGAAVWLNLSFGFLESGQTPVISDLERQAMALLGDIGGGK